MRVCVVDGDIKTRGAARRALLKAGYEVLEACDGASALTTMRGSAEPLVMLVAFDLPDTNGLHIFTVGARMDRRAERHAYILITERPQDLSPAVRDILAQLRIQVLAAPVPVAEMLAAVQAVSDRLRFGASA